MPALWGESLEVAWAVDHDVVEPDESASSTDQGDVDRVVVLGAGRVLLDGPATEVFGPAAWPTLAATFVEPPLAARVGERLGLGSTPTEHTVVEALAARVQGS